MHVNVSCPDCSRQLKLPQEVMGKFVSCPLCKTVFTAKEPVAGKMPTRVEEEESLPLVPLADDDPPREGRRGSRERDRDDRPRRPARDRETADREPARRPSAKRGFKVFVHRDPHDKLAGEFEAEFDADGLTFWRGRGREIVVAPGSEAEYLGEARLLLEVEGRKVEATAVHRDGMNDELAREVVDALGNGDEPFRMPVKPRGKVVWLALMPLALPLLAWLLGDDIAGLGGLLTFSFLGASLVGVALAFTMQRGMATSARAWSALGLTLGGLLILAISLRVDHSGPPEPPTDFSHWIAFAPIDSGFSAEFPALPEYVSNGQTLPINPRLTKYYAVEMGGKTHLIAGYGIAGNGAKALSDFRLGRGALFSARITSQQPLEGKELPGVEIRFEADDGRFGIARYFVKDDRLFGITFVSRKLSPTSKEAQKFLDSFAFDSSTGWPGPGTPGLKPIAAVAPKAPGMPNVPGMPNIPGFPNMPGIPNPIFDPKPPVVANVPGADLGNGGTLLLSHGRDFVWACYRAKTSEVVGVAEDGLVHVCDESGRQIRQATIALGQNVSGATLSPDGKTLAVLGINGKLVLVEPNTLKQAALTPDTVGLVTQSSAAFSPDGKSLVTAHGDAKVRVWDLAKFAVVKRFPLDRNQVVSVAFSHDGKELVCGDAGGTLFHLDANDGRIIAKLRDDFGADLRSLAMSVDGRIVSGGIDAKLRFWKLPVPASKAVPARGVKVTAVAFNPTGRFVAVGDASGQVRLFDAASHAFRADVRARQGAQFFGQMRSLAFSSSGDKLLIADGPRLECWDLARRGLVRPGDRTPVKPRAASGPSELQDRGKLIEHQVALVCPEKGCALLFTADRKVHRYTYPGWKSTRSSPFPVAVKYAALDAASGTLYALQGGVQRGLDRNGEILAYDISALLEDKALPVALEPKNKVRVGNDPRDLLLDASGKSLYFIDGPFHQLRLGRVDTATFAAPVTAFEKKQLMKVALSPDRKSLFLLTSPFIPPQPTLVRFDADTGKRTKEVPIAERVGDSLQVGPDHVLLRGHLGVGIVDLKSWKTTVLRIPPSTSGSWLSPDGTRIYGQDSFNRRLNAFDVPAGSEKISDPVSSLDLPDLPRHGNQGGPTFTVDGKFLLFPSGRLVGLGKPAELGPEPRKDDPRTP